MCLAPIPTCYKVVELTSWCKYFVRGPALLSINKTMDVLCNHHEKRKGKADTWSRMAVALALVTLLTLPLRSESMPLSDCMRGDENLGVEVPEPPRLGVSEAALRQAQAVSGCWCSMNLRMTFQRH